MRDFSPSARLASDWVPASQTGLYFLTKGQQTKKRKHRQIKLEERRFDFCRGHWRMWVWGGKVAPNWFQTGSKKDSWSKKISSLKFEFVFQTCVNDEAHQSSFSLKHTMTVSLNDILSNVDMETHDPRTENNNHLKTYETQLLPGCSGSTEPFSQSVLQLFYCGLSRCYESSPLLPPVQCHIHGDFHLCVCVWEANTLEVHRSWNHREKLGADWGDVHCTVEPGVVDNIPYGGCHVHVEWQRFQARCASSMLNPIGSIQLN